MGIFRQFNQFSFWLGFLIGNLFLWLALRTIPIFRKLLSNIKKQYQESREDLRLSDEYRYRSDLLAYLQGLHLASPLFSLEEILVQPTIIAPPPRVGPGKEGDPQAILHLAIPYLPDWPEFLGTFGYPRLTLGEALSQGANLALIGSPGSGKTIALANLGSQIASLSPEAGELGEKFPIYLHAADIKVPELEGDEHESVLLQAALAHISSRAAGQLATLLARAFEDQRVLVLYDGLDEMDPQRIDQHIKFLEGLYKKHPMIRLVVAASQDYYGRLTNIGLIPVVLAAWTHWQRTDFLNRWGSNWVRHIHDQIWEESTPALVETLHLNNWLAKDQSNLSPIEITLKAWAAYAGDSMDANPGASIEALIRRACVGIQPAMTALEQVATQMVVTRNPYPAEWIANSWSRGKVEIQEQPADQRLETVQVDTEGLGDPSKVNRGTLAQLIEAGILVRRGDLTVGFQHFVIGSYFAAKGINRQGSGQAIVNHPNWSGRNLAIQYLGVDSEIGLIINSSVQESTPILGGAISSSKWLRFAREDLRWRVELMRALVDRFQSPDTAPYQKFQLMAAIAQSGDPGVSKMCAKLVIDDDPTTRQAVCLGLGYLRDKNSVPILVDMLNDPDLNVRRCAGLALTNIGTKEALDGVATSLLHGDEATQQAAAIALANNPFDGHEILKEAGQDKEISIRRAAIFGLEQIRTGWANKLLVELQMEDEQWVVRNAANEILERKLDGEAFIPRPFDPLHNTPWLIQFVGESGEGLSPGKAADLAIRRALRAGTEVQKLAAMDYFKVHPDFSLVASLYEYLDDDQRRDLQNAAFQCLWHYQSAGAQLPPKLNLKQPAKQTKSLT